MTLLHSTIGLLDSTFLYYTLPRLYSAPHDSTTPYNGSMWIYCTLPWVYDILARLYLIYMILLHSTVALLDSTFLYYTLPRLYSGPHDSTTPYNGSMWIYCTLPWVYDILARLYLIYMILLHSTVALLDST